MFANKPLISILLPTKNRGRLLGHAIRSVLGQSYENFEIIISDNNSSDDTCNVVKSFNDHRIIYTNAGRNLPVDANWNFAYSRAKGSYVILMGDDDYLAPNYLNHVVGAIDKYGPNNLFIVQQARYYYADYNIRALKNTLHYGKYNDKEELLRKEIFLKEFFNFRKRFHTSAVCLPKKILDDIAIDGKPYIPPFPDYYAILASLIKVEHVALIRKLLLLVGTTRQGLGSSSLSKDKDVSWKQHPLVKEIACPVLGNFFTNGFYQILRIVKMRFREKLKDYEINMKIYIDRIIDEIFVNRENGYKTDYNYFVKVYNVAKCYKLELDALSKILFKIIMISIPKKIKIWLRSKMSRNTHMLYFNSGEVNNIEECYFWIKKHLRIMKS